MLLCLLCPALALAGPKKIERNTVLRKGAGPYFPIITNLTAGTKVDARPSNGRWIQIRHRDKSGWVSDKAFIKPKPGVDYAGMLNDPGFTKVRSIDIAAATKGAFLTTYSTKHEINVNVAVQVDTGPISPSLVVSIQNSLEIAEPGITVARLPKQKFRNTIVMNMEAEGAFGQTLLSRLVSSGIVTDKDLVTYLNAVAQVVAEQSQRYDVPFKVAVLDDETINGFGLPGGYLLISMGLLKAMNDEAELACLLGHEIAHVALYHGLRELDARSLHRKADSAFDELEMEMGEEKSDVEEDLNTIADEAYLKIIGGRARKDEMEADAYGVAYASAAGYDPAAMMRVLTRIHEISGKREDIFKHHPDMDERLAAIKKTIKKYRLGRKGQLTLADRFSEKVN